MSSASLLVQRETAIMKTKNLFTGSELSKLKTFACHDKDAKREDDSFKEMNDVTNRTNFHRDHDRILYTKSFRRLAHKTQVYLTCENTPVYNDHTRTRLTHTLEVAQVARTLARYLSMNVELIEAIAFGHDVGHAPFGHAGEQQLDIFLSGKIEFHPEGTRTLNLRIDSPMLYDCKLLSERG